MIRRVTMREGVMGRGDEEDGVGECEWDGNG
jgi:hypothetical protein